MGSMVGLTSTYVRSFSRAISVPQDIFHSGLLKSSWWQLKMNFQAPLSELDTNTKYVRVFVNKTPLKKEN